MIELYFVRHGQASFGQPAYDRLSAVGERQAALLGRHFHKNGVRFDAVYSGALRRHVQTAAIAMSQTNGDGSPDIIIDADFNEFDSSDQMMNRLYTVIQEDPLLSDQMKQIHTDHGAIGRIFDIAEKAEMMPVEVAARMRLMQQFRDRISGGGPHRRSIAADPGYLKRADDPPGVGIAQHVHYRSSSSSRAIVAGSLQLCGSPGGPKRSGPDYLYLTTHALFLDKARPSF